MTWVKIDDRIGEHPKMQDISPAAFQLHVYALAYCNRNLTDGFVHKNIPRKLVDHRKPEKLAAELVSAVLWHEVEGGWTIHDYLDYQPSKAQVMREREANAKRQGKHRESKKTAGDNASHNGSSNGVTHAITNGEVTGAPYPYPRPVPDPVPVPVPNPEPEPVPKTAPLGENLGGRQSGNFGKDVSDSPWDDDLEPETRDEWKHPFWKDEDHLWAFEYAFDRYYKPGRKRVAQIEWRKAVEGISHDLVMDFTENGRFGEIVELWFDEWAEQGLWDDEALEGELTPYLSSYVSSGKWAVPPNGMIYFYRGESDDDPPFDIDEQHPLTQFVMRRERGELTPELLASLTA